MEEPMTNSIRFPFQFECCMAGWKRVRTVDLCSAPCCPGYMEVVDHPPLLGKIVLCQKSLNPNSDLMKHHEWKNNYLLYWQ